MAVRGSLVLAAIAATVPLAALAQLAEAVYDVPAPQPHARQLFATKHHSIWVALCHLSWGLHLFTRLNYPARIRFSDIPGRQRAAWLLRCVLAAVPFGSADTGCWIICHCL